MTSPEFLTLREVAARLRISEATARRWAANGDLPAVKIGREYRIPSNEFEAMLATGATA